MERGIRITAAMKRDALRACSFFAPMRPEHIEEIVRHSPDRRYGRRETIFRRGDAGTSLMAVLLGAVDIGVDAPDGSGKRIVYRRIDQGEIFGEIALLDGQPRTADAVAAEDTTLIVVERRLFLPMLLGDPALIERMFAMLCARLRTTSIALEEIALFDVRTRLARVVLRMADEYGSTRPDGGIAIGLAISDQELSYLLGAPARETVNRYINEWKRAGLIVRNDEEFAVLDEAALRTLADGEPATAATARMPARRPRGSSASNGRREPASG